MQEKVNKEREHPLYVNGENVKPTSVGEIRKSSGLKTLSDKFKASSSDSKGQMGKWLMKEEVAMKATTKEEVSENASKPLHSPKKNSPK